MVDTGEKFIADHIVQQGSQLIKITVSSNAPSDRALSELAELIEEYIK